MAGKQIRELEVKSYFSGFQLNLPTQNHCLEARSSTWWMFPSLWAKSGISALFIGTKQPLSKIHSKVGNTPCTILFCWLFYYQAWNSLFVSAKFPPVTKWHLPLILWNNSDSSERKYLTKKVNIWLQVDGGMNLSS